MALTGCATVPADKDNLSTQLDGPLATQLQLDTRQLQMRLERLTENETQTDKPVQSH